MSGSKGAKQPPQEGPVILAPDSFTRPTDPEREPKLRGNQCPGCKRSFFPARTLCPDCFEESVLAPTEMDGRGRIHASTIVRIPAPVGIPAPYAYGYVDLEETGIRVFALFTGADPEWFRPGREVSLVVEAVRRDKQGREVIGYRFGPSEERTTNE